MINMLLNRQMCAGKPQGRALRSVRRCQINGTTLADGVGGSEGTELTRFCSSAVESLPSSMPGEGNLLCCPRSDKILQIALKSWCLPPTPKAFLWIGVSILIGISLKLKTSKYTNKIMISTQKKILLAPPAPQRTLHRLQLRLFSQEKLLQGNLILHQPPHQAEIPAGLHIVHSYNCTFRKYWRWVLNLVRALSHPVFFLKPKDQHGKHVKHIIGTKHALHVVEAFLILHTHTTYTFIATKYVDLKWTNHSVLRCELPSNKEIRSYFVQPFTSRNCGTAEGDKKITKCLFFIRGVGCCPTKMPRNHRNLESRI